MGTLQQLLAKTTRSAHDRIENNPLMHALKNHASLEEPYQWLLKKLYRFTVQGERQLSLYLNESDGFTLAKRYRSDLLLDDLLKCHLQPDPFDDPYFDCINSTGKAIGLLYVMEGSRKGGQFLSALLKNSYPHLPMSYLIGYGSATDSEWERFCILLEHYANTPLQEEIIAGALSSFEILERIFNDK